MKNSILLAILLTSTNSAFATIITLQDGLNGFSSTEETQIKSGDANTNFGTSLIFGADAGGIQGLIRFTGLIGNGVNQIASGSNILSANLTLHTTNASTTNPTVHQMLVDWSENAVTWNNAALVGNGTAGFQADDVDARSVAVGAIPASTLGDVVLDITSVVQKWANGEQNHGLLLLSSSNDAAEFATSQNDFHVRPRLVIELEDPASVPAPPTIVLLLMGMLGLATQRTLFRRVIVT